MKNLFISILCFISTMLFAQEKEINPINWEKMLQKLDQSKIQSGILMDKLVFNNKLLAFNSEKYNMADNEYFKKSLTDLYQLSDKKRFISPDSLASYTTYTKYTNQVAVALINTTYEKLNFDRKNPENSGLKMVDNVLVPIEGKPSFVTQKLFMAAPLSEYFVGKTVDFVFDQNLIFNNGENTIKNLTVAFGEKYQEKEVAIIQDGKLIQSNLKIDYTENGFKSLRFTVTLNNETQITSYSRMYVQTAAAALCTDTVRERGIFTSTIPFQGYNAGDVPLFGKTDYTIFYHTNNNNTQKRLLKPIILVDGFDPGDKRKSQDCDCENDPACYLANSTTTAHTTIYANGMGISHTTYTTTFNTLVYKSIENSMEYEGVDLAGLLETKFFLKQLREAGYDVIVINNINYQTPHPTNPTTTTSYWVPPVINPGGFVTLYIPGYWVTATTPNVFNIDGGADYIERNAMTLASFIQNYVRPQQSLAGGTDDLVMVGPSMGGQITRYALAYMEKKFAETNNPIWKHHTKLWVSLDSPHLGANIPLALQTCIYGMGSPDYLDTPTARDTYFNTLNSIAAKQMSINNFEHTRTSGGLTYNSFPYFDYNTTSNQTSNTTFFTQYYNNLNNNGVAGSNGYPVSNSSFRKIAISNGSLTGQKHGNEGETFFHGKMIVETGFFSTSVIGLEINNKFEPATSQTNRLFEGTFFHKGSLSFKGGRLNFTNNDQRGSMSVVPGGWTDFTTELKKGIIKAAGEVCGYAYFPVEIPNSSFIPTFSALGHLQPNQNWSNPLDTNLLCTGQIKTPFDSYFGEATNTEHTSFNKDSAAWLLQELAGNPQAPHFPIATNLLNGQDVVCNNSNKTYTINDICKVPSPVIYNVNGQIVNGWSVTPNLQIISSTPYSVTVSAIGIGAATITASFQNGQKIEKNIVIGNPLNTYTINRPAKCKFEFIATPQPNTTYLWEYITGTGAATYNQAMIITTSNNKLTLEIIGDFTIQLRLTMTNSCGTTVQLINHSGIVPLAPPYCGRYTRKENTNFYKVFPNPANNIVNIELNDINDQPEQGTTISGQLFDMMAQPKSNINIIDNKATFSVVGINKGIYVLKIYINDQVETHQIAVE